MSIKAENDEINRLRFAFPDAVVSSGFPVNSTLEDIARTLEALKRHEDAPVSITVTLSVQ